MNIIYKSFLKKKVTKIYLWLFIILGVVFSFLVLTKNFLRIKGNEAYPNSFIYFVLKDDVDLSKENNIKAYNKALLVECNNQLTNVFITEDKPIMQEDHDASLECLIDGNTLYYSSLNRVNLISDVELYEFLEKKQDEYYYFISLKNWIDKDKMVKNLGDKYNVEINIEEYKIDSMNYKDVLFLFNIFINIVVILFIILFIISIFNILIDEKKNNNLYHYLGYSKLKITCITINKVLLLLMFPFLFFLISIFITL